MTCPLCGDPGIHACPGKPIPAPTPEDDLRLKKAIHRIKEIRMLPSNQPYTEVEMQQMHYAGVAHIAIEQAHQADSNSVDQRPPFRAMSGLTPVPQE